MADLEAQFSPPQDDPLRGASPSVDDVEARRARAAVEGRLFSGRPARIKVGRYRVEGRIGAGGMGVVYRAHDPELARHVAVKLMNTDAVSDEQAQLARARLVREARAMARLAHPNVIHVYDVGTVEDGVFIAMELVEGESLDMWLAREDHPWTQILRQFIDAGRGLAAAHDAGVVHRDFKPENVLVGVDGRVRVCDFGLAGGPASGQTVPDVDPGDSSHGELGTTDVAASLTRTGTLLGTPKYMAPEQEAGADVNDQSDQFSFCVALHEALYGRPPFEGKTVASYRLNVRESRLLPPPADSRVPAWIHDVLVQGLQTDPDARHSSVGALLDRLEQALVDPKLSVAGQRQRQRRWVGFGLAATAAFAGVLSLAYASPEAPPAPAMVQEADGPPDSAPDEDEARLPPTTVEPVTPPTRVTNEAIPAPPQPPPTQPVDAPTVKRTKPPAKPRPRKQGRTCYFLQDNFHYLGSSRARQSTLRTEQSCYVCRVARRTDNLSAPAEIKCRAYQICAKETADKCEL